MTHISRKTQAVIDLTALKKNYLYIASLAPNSKTLAVIKANAYEHGAVEVAKSLDNLVPGFAVAFVDEALTLRIAGIKKPILVLEGPFHQADFSIASKHNLLLMLHNIEHINWLASLKSPYLNDLWVKVDTGMNRLGYSEQQVHKVIEKLSTKQKQKLILCTHFSTAEQRGNNKTAQQIKRLNSLIDQYQCQYSMANSAGILNWPESHGHYNRLGLALYGISPIDKNTCTEVTELVKPLTPVMTLQADIIAIRKINKGETVGYGDLWQAKRPSVIAVIAIGYADGYPRNAQTGTPVFVNGKIAEIVGRVSMDMITIDVTAIDDIAIGNTVELWGKNISVDTVAHYSNTINYELLTQVSARLPKVFI